MQHLYQTVPTKEKTTFSKWLKIGLCFALPSIFLSAGNISPHNYKPLETDLSDYQKLKAREAAQIFNKICKTVKDTRKAPTFNFIYNYQGKPYYNAYYSPSNNTINFGEGIYDLAADLGADSLDIVATVMAHEIAHFYKDHGWAHAFGKANPDNDIKKNVKESMYDSDDRARMEAEADYFGGIFGYMSGYNTLGVGGAFFDKLYDALEIPDETFGYPSRQDRIAIYNNSKEMLEELIPVFNTANLLNLVRRYEKASMCYDHVIVTFPSREMYNNAGVALAQEAMSMYSPEELKFVYPFGLDLDTRLSHAGTKGAGESKEDKRLRLAKDALDLFNDALRIDDQYAPAYVNAALAHCLLGEYEMALGLANKAIQFAATNDNKLLVGNGHIARGIAFALSNQKADAKKEFKAAESGNALLATTNLDAVTNNVFAKLFKKKISEEIEGEEETIAEVGVEAIEVLFDDKDAFKSIDIKKQNEKRPETVVVTVEEEDFDATLVATYSGPWSAKEELEGFLMTKPDYEGETARGIKIGSSLDAIKKLYGKPTRMLGGSQNNFVFYEKTGLIFLLDADNNVTRWLIYGKVK
ncbi:M48 family metalloprotease [Aureispira sp. CCB-E]|uniref:M48 family metalloprotease n=1 Tax=Aureispira sp. CCB-E TaxID=3051121 RepID=UPI0028684688|nr:M48 family metalloprotease [Aureispira sp. CCB-E]WMX13559.1 metalloendopeptidase [Aureispira sp. CCB-E]